MVKLNKIYTRTGDNGTTGLGDGRRIAKHHRRVAAFGTIDEANAAIGMARLHTKTGHPGLDAVLARIQNDLFDVGADLCTPATKVQKTQDLRISQNQIDRLEHEIDRLNADLEPLTSFVLPGGSAAASALHLARTIIRRAERVMVELNADPDENVSDPALKYINRLSDLLFVMSRYANDKGNSDILWKPGENL